MAKVKTTLMLDAEVLKAAKIRAVELGLSLSRYFEEAADRAARETMRQKPPKKVVVLPTHGKGGLLPGISLENKEQIEEIEMSEWLSSTQTS